MQKYCTYCEVIFNDVKSLVIVEIFLVDAVNQFLIYPWILTFVVSNMILEYR